MNPEDLPSNRDGKVSVFYKVLMFAASTNLVRLVFFFSFSGVTRKNSNVRATIKMLRQIEANGKSIPNEIIWSSFKTARAAAKVFRQQFLFQS